LSEPEKNFVTVKEAVHKMTLIAPLQFMLFGQGLIKLGIRTEIAVFDENTTGTKANVYGTDVYPAGIPYVIVNKRAGQGHE